MAQLRGDDRMRRPHATRRRGEDRFETIAHVVGRDGYRARVEPARRAGIGVTIDTPRRGDFS